MVLLSVLVNQVPPPATYQLIYWCHNSFTIPVTDNFLMYDLDKIFTCQKYIQEYTYIQDRKIGYEIKISLGKYVQTNCINAFQGWVSTNEEYLNNQVSIFINIIILWCSNIHISSQMIGLLSLDSNQIQVTNARFLCIRCFPCRSRHLNASIKLHMEEYL